MIARICACVCVCDKGTQHYLVKFIANKQTMQTTQAIHTLNLHNSHDSQKEHPVVDSRADNLLEFLIARATETGTASGVVVRRGLAHCLQEPSDQTNAGDAVSSLLSAGSSSNNTSKVSPIARMQACRDALTRLDGLGWNRSFHQRLFHEDFLVSIVILCFSFVNVQLCSCDIMSVQTNVRV